jgi:hypothetical protein
VALIAEDKPEDEPEQDLISKELNYDVETYIGSTVLMLKEQREDDIVHPHGGLIP